MLSQRSKKQKTYDISKDMMSFQEDLKEKLYLQIDTVTKNISKTFQIQDEEVRSLKIKVKDQSVEIDQLNAKIARYENRDRKLKFLVIRERKKVLILQKEIENLKLISDQDMLNLENEVNLLINLQENTHQGIRPKAFIHDNVVNEENDSC